jgi:uncharacterized protein YbjT (DUF2867 family)
MTIQNVLLLGGSGFVGTYIANRLADLGIKVTVPSRRRERQRALIALPNVDMVQADIHDEATLVRLMAGQDAVINLVGILHSRDFKLPYSADFAKAHVELPKKIVAACKKTGVRRLVHMSALKAAANAPSEYLRSKADGEAAVLAANGPQPGDLDVTVFRPSVIYGPGDSFLNQFARLLKALPRFPLAYGHAKFQPIYAGDVADAFVRCLADPRSFGKAYDLGGPKVYTLRELVEYVNTLIGANTKIIHLGEFLSLLQAGVLWLLPKPPMSPDNLRSMQVDSVLPYDAELPFGIQARALETIAPGYLVGHAPRVHFDLFRVKAGRG